MSSGDPVRLQALRKFARTAERDEMAAVDLIRGDAQPFPHHPAHELGREEAIVATQEELRGLITVPLHGFGDHIGWRRPPELVNGSKRLWTAVVFVNHIGPILYFWKGRRAAAA